MLLGQPSDWPLLGYSYLLKPLLALKQYLQQGHVHQ